MTSHAYTTVDDYQSCSVQGTGVRRQKQVPLFSSAGPLGFLVILRDEANKDHTGHYSYIGEPPNRITRQLGLPIQHKDIPTHR